MDSRVSTLLLAGEECGPSILETFCFLPSVVIAGECFSAHVMEDRMLRETHENEVEREDRSCKICFRIRI